MKKLLLTGYPGFLASAIKEWFEKNDWQVDTLGILPFPDGESQSGSHIICNIAESVPDLPDVTYDMVIHAAGGVADVDIYEDRIEIVLTDHGPGIEDIELAMSEGYSTAADAVRSLGFGAGMGIPNMMRYADYFNIESTVGIGTKVTMIINT